VLYTGNCESKINKLVILVDKPIGFSSFQIVRALKPRFRKIGHAGTLDPFASGLLIVLTDYDTKQFQNYESCEKEYRGEIVLGIATDTYDISGRITAQDHLYHRPTRTRLESTVRDFVGVIDQNPPPFSALKQGGQKLYALSRKGITVKPPKRTVKVSLFSVLAYDYPVITFRAVVGRGVYIRSLAHDLGARLEIGATMLSLRRHRIGDCAVTQAYTLGALLHHAWEGDCESTG